MEFIDKLWYLSLENAVFISFVKHKIWNSQIYSKRNLCWLQLVAEWK